MKGNLKNHRNRRIQKNRMKWNLKNPQIPKMKRHPDRKPLARPNRGRNQTIRQK